MNYVGFAPYNWGFWLTLAIVNAGLAETKNRSRLRWFLLSLFIGPLATALIVVWPRSTAPKPEPLHLMTSARDRFLGGATAAMVVFVLAAVIAVSSAVTHAGASTVIVSAAVAVVAAIAFGITARGYMKRRTEAQPAPEA